MTTVLTLANMPSSPTDVAVNFLDQTKLLLRSNQLNGDSYSADYVYADGDPTTETSVVWIIRPDLKKNVTNVTMRLTTIQVVTVDSVVTERAPIIITIGVQMPGPCEDTDKLLAMIGTAFGLVFDGVTTKVPNSGIIDAVNRGLLTSLYG